MFDIPSNGFQVGSYVKFIDDDRKGRIIEIIDSIRVKVLTDDDFDIDVKKSKLIPVNYGEESRLINDINVENKSPRECVRRSQFNLISFVDLHFEMIPRSYKMYHQGKPELAIQIAYFREILDANIRHRGHSITFIHGHGVGVLRDEIRSILSSRIYASRCTFNNVSGDSASIKVTIR